MALLFLLGIVVLVTACCGSGQAMMSFPLPYTFEGEYSHDGKEWLPLTEDNSNLSALAGDLFLKGHFNRELPEGITLNFYLNHIGIKRIAVNGDTVYDMGSIEASYAGTDMCGAVWDCWDSTGIQEGDQVEIHLYNPHRFGNKTAYTEFLQSFLAGPQSVVKDWLMKKTRPSWFIGVMILIISLVLLGMSAGFMSIHLSYGNVAFHMGLFSLLMCGYILLDVYDISLRINLIVFDTYALQLCLMFAGLELGQCIRHTLTGKARKAAGAAVFLQGATITVVLLMVLAGKVNIYDTAAFRAVVQAGAGIILLFACFHECIKEKKENLTMVIPFLLLLFSCLLEILNMFTCWWDGGILVKFVFILIFVFQFVRVILAVPKGYMNSLKAQKLEGELHSSRIVLAMSQIRTHFIFNVLNAISGMCKYDPVKADETLIRFSRYLRSNIDILQEDHPVPFLKALEHLEDYLALEQVRFGDKIKFTKNLEVTDFMIPLLVLQPVTENSIKHGLLPKVSGGTIVLSTRQERDQVVISIVDDGIGCSIRMDEIKKKGSVGLNNVLFRLQNMVNGTMEIYSKEGEGTTVIITIPNPR